MIHSNDDSRELRDVTLTFSADPGCKVSVVGSFNGWDHEKTPLAEDDPGEYSVTLKLAPGAYEYKFVCNGRWQADPNAKSWAPNPFGSLNSRVVVTNES